MFDDILGDKKKKQATVRKNVKGIISKKTISDLKKIMFDYRYIRDVLEKESNDQIRKRTESILSNRYKLIKSYLKPTIEDLDKIIKEIENV